MSGNEQNKHTLCDRRDPLPEIGAGGYLLWHLHKEVKSLHQIAVIKAIISLLLDDNDQMSSTDAARMRQKTQRLEIPDKPVSTSTVESVEAACRKFFAERGMIIRWTGYGTKQVKK
jgi:hypothetical protein